MSQKLASNLVAGLPMGIDKDQQIHTKTGSRPVDFNTAGPVPVLIEWHMINVFTKIRKVSTSHI